MLSDPKSGSPLKKEPSVDCKSILFLKNPIEKVKVWETSEICFLSQNKITDKKNSKKIFENFCLQNPISKNDDVRGPNAILRTPGFGIDIIFRDWILEAKFSKFFLEKYFFYVFVLQ